MNPGLVDIHAHLLPGVDDGARDLEEALEALEAMVSHGAAVASATPHFRASLLEDAKRAESRLTLFDAAHEALIGAMERRGIGLRLVRGCELKLDAPRVHLDDPRLRLNGSSTVLVEFATFQVPPFAGNQLRALSEAEWRPLLAHPERYHGTLQALDRIERWREAGVRLQVNGGSFLGRYGQAARTAASELLSRGWVDCVGSDYHAQGEPDLARVRDFLTGLDEEGDLARLLMVDNPARALAGEDLEPAPAVEADDRRWKWRR